MRENEDHEKRSKKKDETQMKKNQKTKIKPFLYLLCWIAGTIKHTNNKLQAFFPNSFLDKKS